MDKIQGATLALQKRLLNGRLFPKTLEQGTRCPIPKGTRENFNDFVGSKSWGALLRQISLLQAVLANNTLTSMVQKLEEQGLVTDSTLRRIKRKKYILTDLGWAQKGNWRFALVRD